MADKNESIDENKKEIIDEAILEMEIIQETLNANTKEILRSITKEEIEELVKESLKEDEDDYEEEVVDVDAEEVPMGGEEIPTDIDTDIDVDTDVDPNAIGDEIEGSEEGDPLAGDVEGMEDEMSDYGDTMDMTGAEDQELIQVYKKLDVNDEIEIVSNENGDIELKVDQPGEFVIKVADDSVESIEEPMGEPLEEPLDEPLDDIETEELPYEEGIDKTNESEVVYEIALEEMENIDSVKAPVGNKNEDQWAGDNLAGGFDEDSTDGDGHAEHIMEEDEVTENAEEVTEEVVEEADDVTESEEVTEEVIDEDDETIEESIPVGLAQGKRLPGKADIGQPIGAGGAAAGLKKESYVKKSDYDTLKESYDTIVKQKEGYKTNLINFRKMLAETVVFNTNLTYVTKLITEYSTTKDEKKQIIERFDDEVSSIKESKKLFKTIEKELGERTPLSETVENKLSQDVNSGASAELNEAQTYVDKDTKRIIGLMSRVENPDKFL